MENLKSQIDLFLTEISIELLGNKIYDINGKRQDKLISLFKALPEGHRENSLKNENANDFLCSLGYQTDFSDDEVCAKEFLNNQLDFILEDANKTSKTNQDIITYLRKYKNNQELLVSDISELNIKKIVERGRLMTNVNRSRVKILNEKQLNSDKIAALNKFYEREKNDLLKMSMDTLRLLKYILNDSQNEEQKGELIGFVHAMRSVKDGRSKPTSAGRSKPYRLPKDGPAQSSSQSSSQSSVRR